MKCLSIIWEFEEVCLSFYSLPSELHPPPTPHKDPHSVSVVKASQQSTGPAGWRAAVWQCTSSQIFTHKPHTHEKQCLKSPVERLTPALQEGEQEVHAAEASCVCADNKLVLQPWSRGKKTADVSLSSLTARCIWNSWLTLSLPALQLKQHHCQFSCSLNGMGLIITCCWKAKADDAVCTRAWLLAKHFRNVLTNLKGTCRKFRGCISITDFLLEFLLTKILKNTNTNSNSVSVTHILKLMWQ